MCPDGKGVEQASVGLTAISRVHEHVVKRKRLSHKKGNLFYTLLQRIKELESHQTRGWVYSGHSFLEITA